MTPQLQAEPLEKRPSPPARLWRQFFPTTTRAPTVLTLL